MLLLLMMFISWDFLLIFSFHSILFVEFFISNFLFYFFSCFKIQNAWTRNSYMFLSRKIKIIPWKSQVKKKSYKCGKLTKRWDMEWKQVTVLFAQWEILLIDQTTQITTGNFFQMFQLEFWKFSLRNWRKVQGIQSTTNYPKNPLYIAALDSPNAPNPLKIQMSSPHYFMTWKNKTKI